MDRVGTILPIKRKIRSPKKCHILKLKKEDMALTMVVGNAIYRILNMEKVVVKECKTCNEKTLNIKAFRGPCSLQATS